MGLPSMEYNEARKILSKLERGEMGISTSAILFFGFSLTEDDVEYLQEWDDKLAAKLGLIGPDKNYDRNNPELEAEYQAYWYKKQELIGSLGVEIGYHGNVDNPIPHVYLTGLYFVAPNGHDQDIPSRVDVLGEGAGADRIEKLDKFCRDLGIKYEIPGWKLVSFWGYD